MEPKGKVSARITDDQAERLRVFAEAVGETASSVVASLIPSGALGGVLSEEVRLSSSSIEGAITSLIADGLKYRMVNHSTPLIDDRQLNMLKPDGVFK